MKKLSYLLSLILLLTIIYVPNVYASKSCAERTKDECTTLSSGHDEYGNECSYYNKCYISNYNCYAKMHCTCFKKDSCPTKDAYGNECAVHGNSCVEKTVKEEFEENDPNSEDTYYDVYDNRGDVYCGNGLQFNRSIANIAHYMIIVFQIVGPVMLILFGAIDLFKAVAAGKDDDIKKSQSTFIKRLITAIIMFLVITIIRFVVRFLSTDTILDCFNCFVNGANSCK